MIRMSCIPAVSWPLDRRDNLHYRCMLLCMLVDANSRPTHRHADPHVSPPPLCSASILCTGQRDEVWLAPSAGPYVVPFDGKESAVTNAVSQVLSQYTTNVTVLSYTVGAPVPYGPSAAPSGSPEVSTSSSGVRRSMLAADSRRANLKQMPSAHSPPSPRHALPEDASPEEARNNPATCGLCCRSAQRLNSRKQPMHSAINL